MTLAPEDVGGDDVALPADPGVSPGAGSCPCRPVAPVAPGAPADPVGADTVVVGAAAQARAGLDRGLDQDRRAATGFPRSSDWLVP